MAIEQIQAADVLSACRQAAGLPETPGGVIEDELLAALLRRCAGYLCPCSGATLRAALAESLQYLDDGSEDLAGRIDGVIEGLIVGGDLLELSDVSIDDPAVKGTWLFAPPPSYIVRPAGSIFLTGIVPDQDAFLPQSLSARISHEGFTRMIAPQPGEDLAGILHEQGLQQLSADVWLKAPRAESAADFLDGFERRLESQPPSGTIEELEILDPQKRVTYYRGRWAAPRAETGTFVARRPQAYGPNLWCFVRLADGVPDRLADLPPRRSRWRGCDTAWHLQMAIDHCRGNPQRYRRHAAGAQVRFDFFSPLPQWSQRRLMIFGRPVQPEGSLFSYCLPASEAAAEERFLIEHLWLERTKDSDSG